MTQYVATGSGKKSLHKRDCPNLKRGDISIREASEQEIEILPPCGTCKVRYVECEFCGEKYQTGGIGGHMRYCEENPDRIGAKVPVLDS